MTIKLKKKITISELIAHGVTLFEGAPLYFGHGTDNLADEVVYIVLSVTKKWPMKDETVFSHGVSTVEAKKILDIFQRRIKEKIPAAYLLEEAWFAGLAFFVNRDVLIPRSPFAELISESFSPWVNVDKVQNILDLCTGSGCIGIACAKYFPSVHVDLADISTPALAVAKKNIQRHGVAQRVKTIASDLFQALADETYDLIVSNPPYVGHEELSSLPEEYYQEPQLGLDGGVSGLDLVHKILAEAATYLNDEGVLYVEVGNTDEVLQACYPEVPFLWQDFEYGGHGVFMLTKEQLLEYRPLFQAKLTQ